MSRRASRTGRHTVSKGEKKIQPLGDVALGVAQSPRSSLALFAFQTSTARSADDLHVEKSLLHPEGMARTRQRPRTSDFRRREAEGKLRAGRGRPVKRPKIQGRCTRRRLFFFLGAGGERGENGAPDVTKKNPPISCAIRAQGIQVNAMVVSRGNGRAGRCR